MVAGGLPAAGTGLLTANPKGALGTGALAFIPGPASQAEAVACARVTEAAVEASAAVLAAGSKEPREALLLTGQASPALRAAAVA